jgi:fatty acid desaturase
MFFHLEHHMFPGVPVKRLPRLAQRLDRAFPEIAGAAGRVIPPPHRPRQRPIVGARVAS